MLPTHQRIHVPTKFAAETSPASTIAETPMVAPITELTRPPPMLSHRMSRRRERAGSRRPHRISPQPPAHAVRVLAPAIATISHGSLVLPASQKARTRAAKIEGQYWRP